MSRASRSIRFLETKLRNHRTIKKSRLDGGNSILEDRFSSSLPIEAPHMDTQTNDETTNTFSMPGNVPQNEAE